MGIISNAFMLMIIISANFPFLFVDPEKQSKSELINSTREMLLSLALLSLGLTLVVIFFYQDSSASILSKKRRRQRRSENEVTQLTTGQQFSTKGLNEAEDALLQAKNHQNKVEEGKEGLSYMEQLVVVLKDPAFVFISLSAVLMKAVSAVYTDNLNAMAASFGFLEVNIFQKREKI